MCGCGWRGVSVCAVEGSDACVGGGEMMCVCSGGG